jgi:hypothetical protein
MKKKLFTALLIFALCATSAAALLLGVAVHFKHSACDRLAENGFSLEYSGLKYKNNAIVFSDMRFSGEHLTLVIQQAEFGIDFFSAGALHPRCTSLNAHSAKAELRDGTGSFELPPEQLLLDLAARIIAFDADNLPEIKVGAVAVDSSRGTIRLIDFAFSKPEAGQLKLSLQTDEESLFPESNLNFTINTDSVKRLGMRGRVNAAVPGSFWQARDIDLSASLDPAGILNASLGFNAGETSFSASLRAIASERVEYDFEMRAGELRVAADNTANSFVYCDELFELIGESEKRPFAEYQPQGVCDIDFAASGVYGAPPEITGKVILSDMDVLYHKFPYPVSVSGAITFDSARAYVDLACVNGPMEAVVSGWRDMYKLSPEAEFPDCDITLSTESIPVDELLYSSLSDSRKKAWLLFAPSGNSGARIHFTRSLQSGRRFEIDLYPHDCSVCYRDIPYPLENITGHMRITPEALYIDSLVAGKGKGKLRIEGRVDSSQTIDIFDAEDTPDYDFTVFAEDFALDKKLVDSLPQNIATNFSNYSLNATADFTCRTVRSGENRSLELTAQVSGESIEYLPEKLLVEKPRFEVSLTGDKLVVTNASGLLAGAAVRASGNGMLSDGKLISFAADLQTDSISAVSLKEIAGVESELLGGQVGVNAHAEIKDGIQSVKADITLHGNTVTFAEHRFIGATGSLQCEAGTGPATAQFSVKAIPEGIEKAELKVEGNVELGEVPAGKVSMVAEGIEIEKFAPASDYVITGIADLSAGDCEFEGALVSFQDAVINFRGLRQKTVSGFGELAGSLLCSGRISSGSLEQLAGDLALGQTVFHGVVFDEISYAFELDKDGLHPGRAGFLRAYDGSGTFGLGISIDEESVRSYSLSLVMASVDVQKLLADIVGPESGFGMNGLLTAELNLEGNITEPEKRRGQLNIFIEDGKITHKHIIDQILSSIFASVREQSTIKSITARNYIDGNTLIINDLIIQLEDLRLQGSGMLALDSRELQLKMGVYMFDKKYLGSDLLNVLGSLIAEVNINGTLDKPVFKTKTLGFSR